MDLNTYIKDLTNVEVREGVRIGIELEFEGWHMGAYHESGKPLTSWRLDADPSLRGSGIEFISHILTLDRIKGALLQAQDAIAVGRASATKRCGVHVHMNMSDVTVGHLWNLIVLYTLAEPTLFKQFADGRETSHFCVPLWANAHFAQWLYEDIKLLRMPNVKPVKMAAPRRQRLHYDDPQLDDMMQMMEEREPEGRLRLFDCNKYSALNFKPLRTLGTIEFRQHPATTSMKQVEKWIDTLVRLREEAAKFDDPLHVLEEYEHGKRNWVVNLLGLENLDIDPLDQDEAEDVATMAAGHIPVPWQDLDWEIK